MTQTVYLFDSRRNLSRFYFAAGKSADWTAPQNASLWRDGYKTLFDPCPAGWRVPKGGEGNSSAWRDFTVDQIKYNNGSFTDDLSRSGAEWAGPSVFGGTAWYPATGYRYALSDSTKLIRVTEHGSGWASTAASAGGFHLNFVKLSVSTGASTLRPYGLPVRCVRE